MIKTMITKTTTAMIKMIKTIKTKYIQTRLLDWHKTKKKKSTKKKTKIKTKNIILVHDNTKIRAKMIMWMANLNKTTKLKSNLRMIMIQKWKKNKSK